MSVAAISPEAKILGKNITRLLEEKGKSVTWLAGEIGVSRQSAYNLATGRHDALWVTVCRVADVLEVSVATLRGEKR